MSMQHYYLFQIIIDIDEDDDDDDDEDENDKMKMKMKIMKIIMKRAIPFVESMKLDYIPIYHHCIIVVPGSSSL